MNGNCKITITTKNNTQRFMIVIKKKKIANTNCFYSGFKLLFLYSCALP